jgi:putative chitinase
MSQSPCGINAALDEAKAGIDNLKEKIAGGLNSIGDLGSVADTIKNKLKEVNVPKLESINLKEELLNLPSLNAEEYAAKVAELKAKFGTAVPDLDAIIAKIPKPVGLNAQGNKDIFTQLNDALGNVGAAFQNVQEQLSSLSIESLTASICDEKKIDPITKKEVPVVPNVEVVQKTIPDPVTKEPIPVVVDPVTTKEVPITEVTPLPPGVPAVTPAPVYETKPQVKPTPPVVPQKNPVVEPKPSTPPSSGFTFAFTKEKLVAAGGAAAGNWYEYLRDTLPKYNITTPERVAAFVGNVGVETSWTQIEESVKYSADFIFTKLNPGNKRFATLDDARAAVAKGAEYVANIIYMVERKLLDPQPGDGWKYRGRGLKQLTFKDNYLRASKAFFGDDRLVKDPDLVIKDKNIAVETGAWYFKTKNISDYADKKAWGECGAIVNAGKPNADPTKVVDYQKRINAQEKAYKAFTA